MDLLHITRCIPSPLRLPALLPGSRVATPVSFCKKPRSIGKCTHMCAASNSDTIVKSSEITSKKEEEHGDLKSWMHRNGLPPCKVMLRERPSHDSKHRPIHYVAASEDLQAGDVAFSVPNSLVVTLDRVLGNETIAELLTTNKLSELACLALYLMYEKKQGKKSFWYPYIRELDRQRGRGQLAVESPLLWSEAELDYLTGSPTKAEVLERAEGIKREYNELDTVWFMAGSLFEQYPYEIPTEAFPFKIFKQAFVAVQSCVVHLQASLNTEDPQYQDKRLAAQRNGKLSVQTFQVFMGKEREAVMDMLPYLRLGYVSDPSEMQSVLSSQGPICPVSSCMEHAVLDQLAGYFVAKLAGYPTTLSEDETLLADPNLNPKKRVATQLVRLEKKILKECLQATVDLINQLPDHSVSPCPAPYAPILKCETIILQILESPVILSPAGHGFAIWNRWAQINEGQVKPLLVPTFVLFSGGSHVDERMFIRPSMYILSVINLGTYGVVTCPRKLSTVQAQSD
ncbi:UNVERIFIED_CONTAM: hypothetical protein Scaly_2089500 [Sesamum calycinum]|uniref:Rubisco LSMT substrate-binding domain-containing protein n=1 Tax=Sesamum calycinum TaxID=2727403 RepID=A0AAW2MKI1_9LAMI